MQSITHGVKARFLLIKTLQEIERSPRRSVNSLKVRFHAFYGRLEYFLLKFACNLIVK